MSVTAGSYQDLAGNAGAGGSTANFTVDTITPTVSVSIDNTDVNIANSTGTVAFTFSEAPTAFALADTSAIGGTLSNLQNTDATHYTAIFTGAANTDIANASVSVTAGSWQDANGNPGSAGSTSFGTVTPTVAVFSNATATFYQTYNGNWLPSQMIDGITTGAQSSPNPPANGWAIYQNTGQSDETYSETALLTLASPLAAGPQNWTITLYQNYGGGHLLGDFSLGYSTAATPNLSSTDTPFTITGASSLNGTTFTSLGAGQLLAGGPLPSTDVYTISLTENSLVPITGLFLNVINDPSNGLPTGGPGRFGNGNFVVTELTANAEAVPFTVDTVTPTVAVSINNTDVNLTNNSAMVTFSVQRGADRFHPGQCDGDRRYARSPDGQRRRDDLHGDLHGQQRHRHLQRLGERRQHLARGQRQSRDWRLQHRLRGRHSDADGLGGGQQ